MHRLGLDCARLAHQQSKLLFVGYPKSNGSFQDPTMRRTLVLIVIALARINSTAAGELLEPPEPPEPAPIIVDEPISAEFSLERAAQALDTAALHWQST